MTRHEASWYVGTMKSRTTLKRVLDEQGRRQNWLAEQVGVHESHISRIVNGLHCNDATQRKIACALGRDVHELWPDTGHDLPEAA